MTESNPHALAKQMAELARRMATPSSVEEVLAGVTAAALEMIPGVDAAGVLLITKGGTFETHAGTSELPWHLDRLQEKFREGPCYQAAIDELIVRTDDFRDESRWPQYSPAVVEIGVLSGLSFKLYTGDKTAGALNLFGFQVNAFDSEAEAIGSVLAAHGAAALMASRKSEQLESALMSRDVIGQAKGIIMERFTVDDIRAFELLRELSQESNTRLVEIARRIIETSQKPK